MEQIHTQRVLGDWWLALLGLLAIWFAVGSVTVAAILAHATWTPDLWLGFGVLWTIATLALAGLLVTRLSG